MRFYCFYSLLFLSKTADSAALDDSTLYSSILQVVGLYSMCSTHDLSFHKPPERNSWPWKRQICFMFPFNVRHFFLPKRLIVDCLLKSPSARSLLSVRQVHIALFHSPFVFRAGEERLSLGYFVCHLSATGPSSAVCAYFLFASETPRKASAETSVGKIDSLVTLNFRRASSWRSWKEL